MTAAVFAAATQDDLAALASPIAIAMGIALALALAFAFVFRGARRNKPVAPSAAPAAGHAIAPAEAVTLEPAAHAPAPARVVAPAPTQVANALTSPPTAPAGTDLAAPAPAELVAPHALDARSAARLSRVIESCGRIDVAEHNLLALVRSYQLDPREWRGMRNLRLATIRAPLVLLGPCGVFVLGADRGTWTHETFEDLNVAARELGELLERLANYTDPVRVALVDPDNPGADAHEWTLASGSTGVVMSGGALLDWIRRHEDRGFSSGDIALIDAAREDRARRKAAKPAPWNPRTPGRG